MRIRFRCNRARRLRNISVVLLSLSLAALPEISRAQSKERPAVPDYDIRFSAPGRVPAASALSRPGHGASQGIRAKLLTMRGSSGEPIISSPNRFGLPRVISAPGGSLTLPSPGDAASAVRAYFRTQAELFGLTPAEAGRLKLVSRQNVRGIEVLHFRQEWNGIPLFQGGASAAVDARGRILRAGVGEIVSAPAVLNTAQMTPAQAVLAAARMLGAGPESTTALLGNRGAGWTLFANAAGEDLAAVAVRLEVFPLSRGSARLAYRLFVDSEGESIEVLLDAESGELLYRGEISLFAGRARVWKNNPAKGDRELVELADEWLAPGVTVTIGNNVDAHLDSDGDNGPDPISGGGIEGGRASSAGQNFDFPGLPSNSDPAAFQASAVTNLFYHINRAHDYFYALGFDEAAGNFQTDNFGRGGEENDPVLAQAQDGRRRFNARYVRRPDGISPRIEMGLFGPLDSALDGSIVFHEYAHGVTQRVVGGPATDCLSGRQEGALGEGWSDYFEISFHNDPVAGEYPAGNTERGARRFAYDKNPYTYEDLGNEGFEVHRDGEIWGATLWEIRQALGAEAADKLVYDGIRLTPCFPSFIDARDAILTADSGRNSRTLWEIFARRGMGAGATGLALGATRRTIYNANFDLPAGLDGSNRGPVIASPPAGPSDTVVTGKPWSYQILAQDPEGDALRYELVEGPPAMDVGTQTGEVKWLPAFTGGRVKINVTDENGARTVHGFVLETFTELAPGTPITIEGAARSQGAAAITVPPDVEVLQFRLRGGLGDPDLRVFEPGPNFRSFRSFRDGSDETLSIVNPGPGRWYVYVNASRAYEDVEISVEFTTPAALEPGAFVADLAGSLSSELHYRISVPTGTEVLRVTTGLGSGDVDLFARFGAPSACQASRRVVAPCEFDRISAAIGNFESIEIDNPKEGEWFLSLYAADAFQGVELAVSTGASGLLELTAVTSAAQAAPGVAAGGLATLWGSGFVGGNFLASAIPLPRELDGLRVVVGGYEAPLLFAAPGQVNFQVPFEAAGQIFSLGSVDVRVYRQGLLSQTFETSAAPFAPAVFTYERQPGVFDPVAAHADGSLVTPSAPALPGEAIIVYLTGLGVVENEPLTGERTASDPLAVTMIPATVRLGEADVQALYSGLTPGWVGLGQVNFRIPDNPPPGKRVALVISFPGASSAPVELATGSP